MNRPPLLLATLLLVASMAADIGAQNATPTPSPAAGSGSQGAVRAQTPADQMASKVRSIRRNEYFYQSFGRRDLFSALVTGEFEPIQNNELVDVNSATLVGVLWGPTDKFALVEDGTGNGFILRVGDRVHNGRIMAIHESSVVASISLYGITSRVILRLQDREGKR